MPLGRYTVEGMTDDAVLVDDEGGTLYAHALPAIDLLLLHHAIGLAGFAIHVRHQLDGQTVLVTKGGMADTGIPADPQNHGIPRGEFIRQFTEFHGLHGAARGIVLGVEIEYQVAVADIVGKTHHAHVGGGQLEIGRPVIHLQHRLSSRLLLSALDGRFIYRDRSSRATLFPIHGFGIIYRFQAWPSGMILLGFHHWYRATALSAS